MRQGQRRQGRRECRSDGTLLRLCLPPSLPLPLPSSQGDQTTLRHGNGIRNREEHEGYGGKKPGGYGGRKPGGRAHIMGSASSRANMPKARDGCLNSKLRTAAVVAGAHAADAVRGLVDGVLGR